MPTISISGLSRGALKCPPHKDEYFPVIMWSEAIKKKITRHSERPTGAWESRTKELKYRLKDWIATTRTHFAFSFRNDMS